MPLEKLSPCKVNLLLNILGKRPDGFHELETVLHPVNLHDKLVFERGGTGIQLTCNHPALAVDATNLVSRAASAFLECIQSREGLRVHLGKRIPMAAGLGGGSGNAATTLLGLNELFGHPLPLTTLHTLGAALGSDVPFFLQSQPALATGRGEVIQPVDYFPALSGAAFLLVHPGFGIATAWAYQQLTRYPAALNGLPGRAVKLMELLRTDSLTAAGLAFYNSLEMPALEKYPLLALLEDFLREEGAPAVLMSGSGSTVFAIAPNLSSAQQMEEKVRDKFGAVWTASIAVRGPEARTA